MTPTATTTLADLATQLAGAPRVLERLGLDYCCGGDRPLIDACRDVGLDPADVLAELERLHPEPAPGWTALGPAELADHVQATHHVYLREELPRLSALADKVTAAHGARHPELLDVRATYEELRADLEPHLAKEEHVLFPMVRELDAAERRPELHCGTLANPVRVMLMEHDRAGELLARLRDLTGGYRTPADGCASYQALYRGLAELEEDTHLHVHKENNVLFPAALDLEHRRAAASS